MSAALLDLSGAWDGVFSYPDLPEAGPTTPFLATITDRGGVIEGRVIEPHEYVEGTAHARILGHRIGQQVHFAKDYRGAGWAYAETVHYWGTLSEDGTRITGEWQIEHWRGPFEMTRDLPPGCEAESEVAAFRDLEAVR